MEQPENLIAKNEMMDILYDLSLLNVIKYQNTATLQQYKGTELEYIFKKYKIDSTQFVQSNSYYASDYKNYKEMFDQVKARVETKKTLLDSLIKKEERAKVLTKKRSAVGTDTVAKKKSIKERLEQGTKETQGVLE